MISLQNHKAVVVIDNGKAAYGFATIAKAVGFIEDQAIEDQVMSDVSDALSGDGAEMDGVNYSIIPVEDYFEVYVGDEDDSE